MVDKQWFTPNEFERLAGRESFKNWKVSIRCEGTTLGKLIQVCKKGSFYLGTYLERDCVTLIHPDSHFIFCFFPTPLQEGHLTSVRYKKVRTKTTEINACVSCFCDSDLNTVLIFLHARQRKRCSHLLILSQVRGVILFKGEISNKGGCISPE